MKTLTDLRNTLKLALEMAEKACELSEYDQGQPSRYEAAKLALYLRDLTLRNVRVEADEAYWNLINQGVSRPFHTERQLSSGTNPFDYMELLHSHGIRVPA